MTDIPKHPVSSVERQFGGSSEFGTIASGRFAVLTRGVVAVANHDPSILAPDEPAAPEETALPAVASGAVAGTAAVSATLSETPEVAQGPDLLETEPVSPDDTVQYVDFLTEARSKVEEIHRAA